MNSENVELKICSMEKLSGFFRKINIINRYENVNCRLEGISKVGKSQALPRERCQTNREDVYFYCYVDGIGIRRVASQVAVVRRISLDFFLTVNNKNLTQQWFIWRSLSPE